MEHEIEEIEGAIGQLNKNIKKLTESISAINRSLKEISERQERMKGELAEVYENIDFWMEQAHPDNIDTQFAFLQNKTDILLGLPLTRFGGMHRESMKEYEPATYKRIIEAEKEARLPEWKGKIEPEEYIEMLRKGEYPPRKSQSGESVIKTEAEGAEPKNDTIKKALATFKTVKEVVEETRLPERTVYRAIKAMQKSEEIESDGGRQYLRNNVK